MKRSTKFLIAFLIALAIAVGIGFLFNQKEGEKTIKRQGCYAIEEMQGQKSEELTLGDSD